MYFDITAARYLPEMVVVEASFNSSAVRLRFSKYPASEPIWSIASAFVSVQMLPVPSYI